MLKKSVFKLTRLEQYFDLVLGEIIVIFPFAGDDVSGMISHGTFFRSLRPTKRELRHYQSWYNLMDNINVLDTTQYRDIERGEIITELFFCSRRRYTMKPF